MSDQVISEDFRSQVQRLVAEGKLSAEDAAGLLEGQVDEGAGQATESLAFRQNVKGADSGDCPHNLLLKIKGYILSVVHDASLGAPQLKANREDELSLQATGQGWVVERTQSQNPSWDGLRAILTLPFVPEGVRAEIHGGGLTLPDITGEMHADVNGGNIRMGNAASLWAEINGGNLTAARLAGPTQISVNGGNLSLEDARSLNATVNGGNLKWAGQLTSGDHRVEVNAGNATLHLLPSSSVRLDGQVTVGGLKADFPTEKKGNFINTRHSGQLGSGEAFLSAAVSAGQLKLVTA